MKRTHPPDDATTEFFVFRSPLLPFDELEAFGCGLDAPRTTDPGDRAAALAADRERLRSRLGCLVARPEIREALFLASPSLEAGLEAWRHDPDGKKGRRAEQALVRYFYRMAARATPFGLFSGCSLGRTGEPTRLSLPPRAAYRRHTRLDMDYLFALSEGLGRDPELRRELAYRPNSTLYRAAGRLRYVESRLNGRTRSHHLVAIHAEGYLEEVLRQAAGGATIAELARSLAEREDVPLDEAEEFVTELVDSQLLVSELSPPVTGQEPVHDLVEQLERHPVTRPVAAALGDVGRCLDALDAAGVGNEPEAYREAARRLEPLPTEVELSRLLQVDMIKPAPESTLGREVLDEIERGVDLLRRWVGAPAQGPLDRFRQDFTERYEGRRRVPLVEVLDEEIGLGFELGRGHGVATSPLLDGLALPPPAGNPQTAWGPREALLLEKVLAARAEGATEIELRAEDLRPFSARELPPIPDAFHVMATVASSSATALGRGDLKVFLRHVGGPSGAILLGRFCHADEALSGCVERHLRSEEAHDPEAVYAEVVHLPQGRIGNVLLRPVLRSHEIPFLGRSGAPPERQIPITDLLVSIEEGKVVLHSRRLGRRVVPRLTSAHNFTHRAIGLYRFLGSLQQQGNQVGLAWRWGALDSALFLPRVTSGRLVLARARWLVPEKEIRHLALESANERFEAVQQWRARRRMPRWVVLIDGDNELPVDLDNALCVETFVAVIQRRTQLLLTELFPSPEELWVRGPEGRFVHELVIPYVRRAERPAAGAPLESTAPAPAAPRRPALADAVRGTFLPGSEWLYAKLYTGASTADEILAGVVGPLVRRLVAQGAVDRWFFLRFGDPQWHLRLRLHGDPRRLAGEALRELHDAAAPLLDDGRIWRLQIDTYVRELDRYGGGEGIDLAERFFAADSEAVLAIVESLDGDADADSRWLLAARGIDRLLADLGIESERKLDLLESMHTAYAREHRAGPGLRKQLASRLRRERRRVEEALDPVYDAGHPMAAGYRAIDRRSRELAPIVSDLAEAEASGRLTVSLHQLAKSFIHMFANRLLRAEGRAHELVLYDFLLQHTRSRQARERADRKRADAKRGGGKQEPRSDAPRARKAVGGKR